MGIQRKMDEVDGCQTAAVAPACPDQVQAAAVATPERMDRDPGNAGDRWPRLIGELGDLLDLAEAADVFQGSDRRVYATVATNKGHATWPIDAPPFLEWLKLEYLEAFRTAPEKGDLREAIAVMGAWCRRSGAQRPVALRVASHAGHLYLDLGDATGTAVEITTQGWQVVERPPVCFLRPPDLGALPRPVRGGTLADLARHLNASDGDHILLTAWILAALRPQGPHAVLAFSGPEGNAKSETAALLCALLDPGAAVLWPLPGSERGVFDIAQNRYILLFDNASALSTGMSDALCRLSTGSAWSGPPRGSGMDKVPDTMVRPVIITGIPDLIGRPDLADRTLRITLGNIPDTQRRTREDLRAAFEADHARLLGALLDAAVIGLRRLPQVDVALPRMADFARWVLACAPAFTTQEHLLALLHDNKRMLRGDLLGDHPVAQALMTLMRTEAVWCGTATALLGALHGVRPKGHSGRLPAGPAQLSAELGRLEQELGRHGLMVKKDRAGKGGERHIVVSRIDEDQPTPDNSSV